MKKQPNQEGEIEGLNPPEQDYESKPRRMDVKGYEVGGHEKFFPGDEVKLKVKGHVHGVMHNGHIVVHIHDVKLDGPHKLNERKRLGGIAERMFGAKEGH